MTVEHARAWRRLVAHAGVVHSTPCMGYAVTEASPSNM
jgi:hypothetical protein